MFSGCMYVSSQCSFHHGAPYNDTDTNTITNINNTIHTINTIITTNTIKIISIHQISRISFPCSESIPPSTGCTTTQEHPI